MKKLLEYFNLKPALLFSVCMALMVSCEDTIEVQEYGIINGSVHDALTGDPIEGVTVSTNPASNIAVTDENGIFIMTQVPAGDITLSAKKLYYKTYTVSINVLPETIKETYILLEKSDGYELPTGNFSNPVPSNGTSGIKITDTLSWTFETDRSNDTVTYDLRIYEAPGSEPLIEFIQIADTFAVIDLFKYSHTYYWQVSAIINDSAFSNSQLWSFTTEDFPQLPILFSGKTGDMYNIYGIDTLNFNAYQLTYGQTNINWNPRSNPVTGRIAFISNRDIDMQIYHMNQKGEEIKKVTVVSVTGNYNNGIGFCWSPDGSMVLYPHYNKLYRINADGTGLTLVATAPDDRHFTSCDWSKYTSKIVVATTGNNPYENEIYLMNADGTDMAMLVDDLPGIIQNPSFSIDGQKILFTHDADGLNSWDGRQLNSRIYLLTINDSTLVDLSLYKEDGTNDLMPRFSPDGSGIIFVNTSNIQGSKHNIYIQDTDGNKRRLMIEDATMPEWVISFD